MISNIKSEEGYLIGIVTQWNSLAAYSNVAIICSFLFFDKKKIITKRNILLTLIICIDFYTIIVAHSRTPLVVLMIFTIIMFFYLFFTVLIKKINKKVVLISFILICVIVCAIVSIAILKKNAISSESMSFINLINRISSNRINIWKVCLTLFKDSPLIGVNNNYYDEVLSSYFGYGPSPHNVYLSLMTINGLPSLLIYIFIIGYSIVTAVRLIRNYKYESDKIRIYYYLAILCGLLIGDLFECFSIRSYMPSAYIIILVFAAIEMERITLLKNKNTQG
ncbi:MAG: O-antigen ligase family protein [Spirochaetales bacterium]|nr:O-antigen ligase family protein [Spirochaetales bacterium]